MKTNYFIALVLLTIFLISSFSSVNTLPNQKQSQVVNSQQPQQINQLSTPLQSNTTQNQTQSLLQTNKTDNSFKSLSTQSTTSPSYAPFTGETVNVQVQRNNLSASDSNWAFENGNPVGSWSSLTYVSGSTTATLPNPYMTVGDGNYVYANYTFTTPVTITTTTWHNYYAIAYITLHVGDNNAILHRSFEACMFVPAQLCAGFSTGINAISQNWIDANGNMQLQIEAFGSGALYPPQNAQDVNTIVSVVTNTGSLYQLANSEWSWSSYTSIYGLKLICDQLYIEKNTITENLPLATSYLGNGQFKSSLLISNFDNNNEFNISAPLDMNMTTINPSASYYLSGNNYIVTNIIATTYTLTFMSGVGYGRDFTRKADILALQDNSTNFFNQPSFETGWSQDWSNAINPFTTISLNSSVVYSGVNALELSASTFGNYSINNAPSLLASDDYYLSFNYYVQSFSSSGFLLLNAFEGSWKTHDTLSTSVTNRWINYQTDLHLTGNTTTNGLKYNLQLMFNNAYGVIFIDNVHLYTVSTKLISTQVNTYQLTATINYLTTEGLYPALNENISIKFLNNTNQNPLFEKYVLSDSVTGQISYTYQSSLSSELYSIQVLALQSNFYNKYSYTQTSSYEYFRDQLGTPMDFTSSTQGWISLFGGSTVSQINGMLKTITSTTYDGVKYNFANFISFNVYTSMSFDLYCTVSQTVDIQTRYVYSANYYGIESYTFTCPTSQTHYDIPFSSFSQSSNNLENSTFNLLFFQAYNSGSTFYLDDIQLLGSNNYITTTTSSASNWGFDSSLEYFKDVQNINDNFTTSINQGQTNNNYNWYNGSSTNGLANELVQNTADGNTTEYFTNVLGEPMTFDSSTQGWVGYYGGIVSQSNGNLLVNGTSGNPGVEFYFPQPYPSYLVFNNFSFSMESNTTNGFSLGIVGTNGIKYVALRYTGSIVANTYKTFWYSFSSANFNSGSEIKALFLFGTINVAYKIDWVKLTGSNDYATYASNIHQPWTFDSNKEYFYDNYFANGTAMDFTNGYTGGWVANASSLGTTVNNYNNQYLLVAQDGTNANAFFDINYLSIPASTYTQLAIEVKPNVQLSSILFYFYSGTLGYYYNVCTNSTSSVLSANNWNLVTCNLGSSSYWTGTVGSFGIRINYNTLAPFQTYINYIGIYNTFLGDTQNWNPANAYNYVSPEGHLVNHITSTSGAYISQSGLSINTAIYKYLTISIKADSSSNRYFGLYGMGHYIVTAQPLSSSFQTFTFDLSSSSYWTGIFTSFLIAFGNSTGLGSEQIDSIFTIDYILLTAQPLSSPNGNDLLTAYSVGTSVSIAQSSMSIDSSTYKYLGFEFYPNQTINTITAYNSAGDILCSQTSIWSAYQWAFFNCQLSATYWTGTESFLKMVLTNGTNQAQFVYFQRIYLYDSALGNIESFSAIYSYNYVDPNGYLITHGTSQTGHAYLYRSSLSINTVIYKYLTISIKADSSSNRYFGLYGNGHYIVTAKSLSSNFQTFTFDLSASSYWTGTITSLSIVFGNTSSLFYSSLDSVFTIDYMLLTADNPTNIVNTQTAFTYNSQGWVGGTSVTEVNNAVTLTYGSGSDFFANYYFNQSINLTGISSFSLYLESNNSVTTKSFSLFTDSSNYYYIDLSQFIPAEWTQVSVQLSDMTEVGSPNIADITQFQIEHTTANVTLSVKNLVFGVSYQLYNVTPTNVLGSDTISVKQGSNYVVLQSTIGQNYYFNVKIDNVAIGIFETNQQIYYNTSYGTHTITYQAYTIVNQSNVYISSSVFSFTYIIYLPYSADLNTFIISSDFISIYYTTNKLSNVYIYENNSLITSKINTEQDNLKWSRNVNALYVSVGILMQNAGNSSEYKWFNTSYTNNLVIVITNLAFYTNATSVIINWASLTTSVSAIVKEDGSAIGTYSSTEIIYPISQIEGQHYVTVQFTKANYVSDAFTFTYSVNQFIITFSQFYTNATDVLYQYSSDQTDVSSSVYQDGLFVTTGSENTLIVYPKSDVVGQHFVSITFSKSNQNNISYAFSYDVASFSVTSVSFSTNTTSVLFSFSSNTDNVTAYLYQDSLFKINGSQNTNIVFSQSPIPGIHYIQINLVKANNNNISLSYSYSVAEFSISNGQPYTNATDVVFSYSSSFSNITIYAYENGVYKTNTTSKTIVYPKNDVVGTYYVSIVFTKQYNTNITLTFFYTVNQFSISKLVFYPSLTNYTIKYQASISNVNMTVVDDGLTVSNNLANQSLTLTKDATQGAHFVTLIFSSKGQQNVSYIETYTTTGLSFTTPFQYYINYGNSLTMYYALSQKANITVTFDNQLLVNITNTQIGNYTISSGLANASTMFNVGLHQMIFIAQRDGLAPITQYITWSVNPNQAINPTPVTVNNNSLMGILIVMGILLTFIVILLLGKRVKKLEDSFTRRVLEILLNPELSAQQAFHKFMELKKYIQEDIRKKNT